MKMARSNLMPNQISLEYSTVNGHNQPKMKQNLVDARRLCCCQHPMKSDTNLLKPERGLHVFINQKMTVCCKCSAFSVKICVVYIFEMNDDDDDDFVYYVHLRQSRVGQNKQLKLIQIKLKFLLTHLMMACQNY